LFRGAELRHFLVEFESASLSNRRPPGFGFLVDDGRWHLLEEDPDDVGRRIIENLKVEVKFRVTSRTVGGYGVSARESGRGLSQMRFNSPIISVVLAVEGPSLREVCPLLRGFSTANAWSELFFANACSGPLGKRSPLPRSTSGLAAGNSTPVSR